MDSEEEKMLKSSEEALENHILTVRKSVVDDTLMDLMDMKISLLKEYDRNTVKMTSNLMDATSAVNGFETLQNTIQQRVETHKEQYEAVHELLETITLSMITLSIIEAGSDIESLTGERNTKTPEKGNDD